MSDNDIQTRFFRDRRLLLGVSLVLLAHQLFGITVENSAQTMGLRFEISDPSKLWWVVWAIWLWTAICAMQQLYSIRPWTLYPKDRSEETRDRLSNWIALRRVRRGAMPLLRSIVPREFRPEYKVKFASRERSETPGGQLHEYACIAVTAQWQCELTSMAAQKATEFEAAIKSAGWETRGGSASYENGKCELSRIIDVRIIPIRDERAIRVGALIFTALSTSYITDFFAPLVIAAAPLVVWLYETLSRYHWLLRPGIIR